MRTGNVSNRGFTMVEIMIVVAIIGLLTAIAIPNFIRHRNYAQQQACIKNLSVIDSAKQIWGVEYGKSTTDIPATSELIGVNLYIKVMPVCPAGGSYSINAIGSAASCTIAGHSL